MKKHLKKLSTPTALIVGILIGTMLSGTVALAATGILANPTTSKFYVDGKEVQVTAYNINGNNYFKLRDVAAAVDFGVEWDGAKNSIYIDTTTGYKPEAPAATQTSTHTYPTMAEVKAMYEIQNTDNSAYFGKGPYLDTNTGYDLKWDCYINTGAVLKAVKGQETWSDTYPGAGDGRTEQRPVWAGKEYTVTRGYDKAIEGTAVEPLPQYDRSLYKVLPNITITGAAMESGAATYRYSHVYNPNGTMREENDFIIYNVYETQRLINDILKYAPLNPELWKDNDPSTGIPAFSIVIDWNDVLSGRLMFPYNDDLMKRSVSGTWHYEIQIFASDSYSNGSIKPQYYYGVF